MDKNHNNVFCGKVDSSSPAACKESNAKVSRVRTIILLIVALIVITLAVYWQVGEHEFLNYDDDAYVTENAHVARGITSSNIVWAFTSVDESNWHPITWLSHMADVEIFGMNPRGHHLTNVIIHTISTVLLFLLLFRITSDLWQSSFVAALFALHPLHVESVAWVAERKDVLSAFFWFLTLFLYSAYVRKQKPALYLLTLLSFVLGLMSKPMLVTLPLVMLLLDFWPLNRYGLKEHESKQRQLLGCVSPLMALLKEKIPFFVFTLFSAVITFYSQNKGGAMRNFIDIPLGFRCQNGIIAYVAYLRKTVWPYDLAVFYPYPTSFLLWQTICSLSVLIIISTMTIRLRRCQPYLAVGWFWFLVTLVPVIGIIQVGGQSMADRYTYIPLIGLLIMVTWGLPALTKELPYWRVILTVLASMVIMASAILTRQQLGYWRDNISLFQHALDVTTGNSNMHVSLGFAYDKKGHFDAAMQEYQKALQINPNSFEAHNYLGTNFDKKGQIDAAIQEYQKALQINPNSFKVHYNLGIAFDKKGDFDTAIQEYQKALQINPDSFEAHNNVGFAFDKKGDFDAAIQEYQKALQMNPDYFEAHYNLGIDLDNKGQIDAAVQEYQKALKINPNHCEAHNNLGIDLVSKGDLDSAIKEFQEALTIKPNDLIAQQNLGFALALKRRQ